MAVKLNQSKASNISKDKVYIQDFIKLILKYKFSVLIILAICIGAFVEMSVLIPKRYKSDFELSIYPKYFKNPIINNVIPGVSSSLEMTQTIDANIKELMNDEFIDEVAEKFNFYKKSASEIVLTKEREDLRDRFKAYSSGSQSYRIDFFDSNPKRALAVSNFVLDKVRGFFINSRIETIETVRKIMLSRLESLNVTKKMSGAEIADNALASNNPAVMRSEIAKIDQDISALKKQFNVNHPRVLKLIQRRATIVNWLEQYDPTKVEGNNNNELSESPLLLNPGDTLADDIASKLFAKYHDINIALELEKKSLPSYIGVIKAPSLPIAPIWPKKRLFASIGFVIGLIICFLYVLFKEVVLLSIEDKLAIKASALGGLVLGEVSGLDETSLAKALLSDRLPGVSLKRDELLYDKVKNIEIPLDDILTSKQ